MTDPLKAVDTISRLLPFLKSFTGVRRREYLEKLITPLYDGVERTHKSYLLIFEDARNALQDLLEKAPKQEPEYLIGDEAHRLRGIISAFAEARQVDEHLRDAVRAGAQDMIRPIKWPEERRFLILVCLYFLGTDPWAPDDDFLDREARQIEQKGGVSLWDTPSIALYQRLKEAPDARAALDLVKTAREALNRRHTRLDVAYRRVLSAIVLKG